MGMLNTLMARQGVSNLQSDPMRPAAGLDSLAGQFTTAGNMPGGYAMSPQGQAQTGTPTPIDPSFDIRGYYNQPHYQGSPGQMPPGASPMATRGRAAGKPPTGGQTVPRPVQVNPSTQAWMAGAGPGSPGTGAQPQAPMGSGLMGAFSGNPAFQQQLGAIMQGQGPGMQAPQFTPPIAPVNTSLPKGAGAARGGLGGGFAPGSFGAGMGSNWMAGGAMQSLLNGDNVNWTPTNWFGQQGM